jgi:type 1 glutamine amidotransferase
MSLPLAFRVVVWFAFAFASACITSAQDATKTILLIAGVPSHGPGAHEHNAGVLLLQKCLNQVPGISTRVVLNGWPKEASVFENVDAIVIYCDGGVRHLALQDGNLNALGKVLERGAGLALLHYAVEPTLQNGQPEFLRWVGGAFEINWSVNPHWDADFKTLPDHPIARGVSPFKLRDEWYFNMRFVEGMKGITPILVAKPDATTTTRRDGPHSGNPHVRAAVARGDAQTVAWAYERTDGKGRGFGFTGGHFHKNWGNENFRRVALNAILWIARADVPATGVVSTITAADLEANLDSVDPESGRKVQPKPEVQGLAPQR